MKFLIDANLPYSLQAILSPYGQCWHVRDLGLATAHDSLVMTTAIRHKAVLITRDLEFGNPFMYPPDTHHGVMIIRVQIRTWSTIFIPWLQERCSALKAERCAEQLLWLSHIGYESAGRSI